MSYRSDHEDPIQRRDAEYAQEHGTMDVTIRFVDVGMDRWNGAKTFQVSKADAEDPDTIAELAWREAHHHLASANVETVYNAETNDGNIFAGFHHVGRFEVIHNA